ncbi:MAG: gluconokinase, partial [Mesorhizobium sp.]
VHDGQKAVAACSALKRSYRDRLRRFSPDIVFVYLKIDRETAWRRVAGRKGHFMPASLVDSQFATLEEPGLDEQAVTVDATRSIADIARKLLG